jgi:sulfur-oxidizing protein SoxZ
MADPMKIRAGLKGDIVDVRVLMNHPMETGQRKDGAGNLIPVHFIQEIAIKLNGKTVIDAQISQAVSRNPVFSFRLKGAKPGDKLEISWLDNRGERNSTETSLA